MHLKANENGLDFVALAHKVQGVRDVNRDKLSPAFVRYGDVSRISGAGRDVEVAYRLASGGSNSEGEVGVSRYQVASGKALLRTKAGVRDGGGGEVASWQ